MSSILERILSDAAQFGSARVQFLELLITQKLKALYPDDDRLDAVRDLLGEQLTHPEATQRISSGRWVRGR
ncbi:hypothetical protein CKO25_11255 [Thiocapsa imhoffii]|uniref:Uncharacterized protein n=1 Tax=Thiocapsa imhoffii TaxID=382777 RepID=A0A9X0WI75_9GAMM|nr:hypothetical protein [Thiocapsa imhoffii]MBK1645207.1 hypothetical protein [Thiocapsa imhoffii]